MGQVKEFYYKFMNEFRLYRRFVRVHLLSGVEYKGWWLTFLNVVVYIVVNPLVIGMMFNRFGNIGDWTLERILLVYGLTCMSFSISKMLCNGFDYFPWYMVRNGDFDRVMLRPKTLFTQVAASAFNVQRLANPVTSLIIIIWAFNRLDISLTVQNFVMFIFAMTGGALIYAGVFIFCAAISFFTINALNWIYIFTNASTEITRIPVDHMPRLLRTLFMFVMPVLVVTYFPASAIGGWGGSYWRGWLALPAGAAFFCGALIMWRIGVRHYKSTGS